MENNIHLRAVSEAADVSLEDLVQVIRFLSPPDNFRGLSIALPRLCNTQKWFSVVGYSNFFPLKIDLILRKLADNKKSWSGVLPTEVIASLKSRNFHPQKITNHLLYTSLTELSSDLYQEEIVIPFLAVLIIAIKTDALSDSTLVDAQRTIRKLFNSETTEGRLLRQLSEEGPPLSLNQILKIAGHFKSLSWVYQIIEQKKKPKKPTSRKQNTVYVPRRLEQADWSTNEHRNAGKYQSLKIKNIAGRTIYSNKQVSIEGMAPVEIGSSQTYLIAPPRAEYSIELECRRLALFSEMDHQYLPNRWENLTENEVVILGDEIASLLDSDNIIGLLLALSIATARNITDILLIPLVGSDTSPKSIWLSTDLATWGHPVYQPLSAFRPNKNNGRFLHKTSSNIALNLPSLIKEKGQKFLRFCENTRTLGEAISLTPESAVILSKRWLADYRYRSNNKRITLSRIRDSSLQLVLSETMDPALTSHLFWLDSGSSSSIYYATYHADDLQKKYSDSFRGVFLSTPTSVLKSYYVGSKLLVKQEFVERWIDDWKNKISWARKQTSLDKLIEVHNQITGYSVMMLMFVSGHRSVADPFENIINFDELAATFIVADKMNGNKDDGRMVWLCDTAVQQLKMYLAHLKALSTRLLSYDTNLSNNINAASEGSGLLPLFFILERSPKHSHPIPIKLTPSLLSELLELPVPVNWPRHYLSTSLRVNNVPVEYIDQHLDHVKKGQRFDAQYSMISVNDIGCVLQPILDKITLDAGWSVISGIQSYLGTNCGVEFSQRYWTIGSDARAYRRVSTQAKLRNRTKNILKLFKDDDLNKEGLTKLLVNIKSEFHTEAEQTKVQILTYRFLKLRSARAEKVLRKYWPNIVQYPKDASIFNLNHGAKLAHARYCKSVLHLWVSELADKEFSQTQWLAVFISSAIFEGGLVQERFIHQLLSKDVCPFYHLNNIVWFDFIDHKYAPQAIRRWLPDTLTTLIFIKLRKQSTGVDKISNFSSVRRIITKKFKLRSFATLLSIAKSLYHQELPAYLAHYVTGKTQSASLPPNAWLRLMTGKRFQSNEANDTSEIKVRDKKIVKSPNKNTLQNYNATEYYEKGEILRSEFRVLLYNSYKRGTTKKNLIEQLTHIYNLSSPLPPFLAAFMMWTISIISDGRIKDILAISTVRNYFLNLGRHISFTTFSYSNFEELDDEDFSDIYIRILDSTTRANRPANAALLESFHDYLQKEYSVPDVDFNSIEPNRKKTSVRPNLLLPYEYQLVRKSLSRVNRSILALSFRAGMRGKEIRELSSSGLKITSEHPNVFLRKKTKTSASIRQISLINNITRNEITDLNRIKELCIENGIEKVASLFSFDSTQVLQNEVRCVTGDPSMVTYDLRHSAVTISIVKHALSPKDWPLFLHEKELEGEKVDDVHQNYKSRRTLFQIAMQAGHSSPSTTLTSYMHLLDWSLHCELVNRQNIDYALLNKLSGISSATLRKARERNQGYGFDDYVLEKVLGDSLIPMPDVLAEMCEHDTSGMHNPKVPQSIYTVLECLQLFSNGVSLEVIAEKSEIDINIIRQWIVNSESVALDSGYKIKKLGNNQNWLFKKTSTHLKALAYYACNRVENDTMSLLCRLFTHRYQHTHDAVFFDSEVEMNDWIEALGICGVLRDKMTVLIPSNHSFVTDSFQRGLFLDSNKLVNYQLLSQGVNARSWSAAKKPGLGISLKDESDVDRRSTLQSELNLLIYAACHLINAKNHIFKDS